MRRLIEFQRSLATDILFGGTGSATYLRAGPVAADIAIGVHRNTVSAALVNAIRMSCPTLSAVVDVKFFEQAVRDYARSRPPHGACLAAFGHEFAEFLDMYPPARGFPFFGDIVRFDTAVDRTAHDLPGAYRDSIAFGSGGSCKLLASLKHVSTQYPVDVIRDEIEAGRAESLEGLDMTARVRHFAFWRSEAGASVKKLTDPAGRFLEALLAEIDGSSAANPALDHADFAVLSAVQREILIPPLAIIGFDQPLE